jgi:hypothetical protein
VATEKCANAQELRCDPFRRLIHCSQGVTIRCAMCGANRLAVLYPDSVMPRVPLQPPAV